MIHLYFWTSKIRSRLEAGIRKDREAWLQALRLPGASTCCAEAEPDTQFTVFDLSALKKQCLISFDLSALKKQCLISKAMSYLSLRCMIILLKPEKRIIKTRLKGI